MAQWQAKPCREQSLTKVQSIRAGRRNSRKPGLVGWGQSFSQCPNSSPSLDLAANSISKRTGACKNKSKVCAAAAWSPQGALASCHPSFPGFLVLLHLQLNSVPSFAFHAWSGMSYHQAFTPIKSKQKINQLGISYGFSPAPRCFVLFFFFSSLEVERSKKDNCQTWVCLKGCICSRSLCAFSRTGRSLWWKARLVLALWSPLISSLLSRTWSGSMRQIQAFCPSQISQNSLTFPLRAKNQLISHFWCYKSCRRKQFHASAPDLQDSI